MEITTMTTPPASPGVVSNGRQRRNLSDTIAKLDEMIDGLSTAIPDTIRDELRTNIGAAVSEGVRAALLEIFASEEVQAMLRGLVPATAPDHPTASAPPSGPSLASRLLARTREALVAGGRWARKKVGSICGAIAERVRRCRQALAKCRSRLAGLWALHKALVLALGVGATAAALTVVVPGWLAAMISGVSCAC